MASEIRVNQIQNRSGLSTVTFTDTGPIISGVTTVSGGINVAGIITATNYDGKVNNLTYPTAGPLSNRNLIINGAMTVAQRGTSSTITVNTQTYPCIDRWKIELGTQTSPNYTYSRDGDAPVGFTSSFKITNNASASQGSSGTIYNLIGQNIEQNVIDCLGWGTSDAKPITISFWVKSNVTGNDVVELVIRRNGTISNDSIAGQITINAADTWEYKTITFPETTTNIGSPGYNSLGFNMFFSFQGLVGGNKISSYGTWDNNNRLGGPAGDTNVFASTSGAYMNITGVQLEVGENATPFEHRSYGQELALCQRYFERIGGSRYAAIGVGKHRTTSESYFNVVFQVEKRAVPSVSWTGTIITTDRYFYDQSVTSLDQSEPSRYGFHGSFFHPAVGAEHRPIFILGPPSGTFGYMDFSAEL